MQYTVVKGQTMIDVSIQLYGSVEEVFQLADDNNLSITDTLEQGRVLQINESRVIKPNVVAFLNNKVKTINTGNGKDS